MLVVLLASVLFLTLFIGLPVALMVSANRQEARTAAVPTGTCPRCGWTR